ncbi:hypothetical protein [Streptomyces sp. SLBN-8D4]|uniref:hypothetical protein n=1 Tax=Streptomyces sp. SLBN-8D4 TaxID=3377728 RepID=UPI003C7B30F3
MTGLGFALVQATEALTAPVSTAMPMSITFAYSGTAVDAVAFVSNFPLLGDTPSGAGGPSGDAACCPGTRRAHAYFSQQRS